MNAQVQEQAVNELGMTQQQVQALLQMYSLANFLKKAETGNTDKQVKNPADEDALIAASMQLNQLKQKHPDDIARFEELYNVSAPE